MPYDKKGNYITYPVANARADEERKRKEQGLPYRESTIDDYDVDEKRKTAEPWK